MMALRVDVADAVVEVTVLPHERAALITVELGGAHDAYLDAADLRDLARIATIAADELDRIAEVTP
jgi:hypothetical protein